MLDALNVRGFSQWENMKGRGSIDGDPHLGSHTWPEINAAVLAIVEDEKVDVVLQKIKNIDHINKEVGIRAFVWDVLQTV
jgi:hypothetical protein